MIALGLSAMRADEPLAGSSNQGMLVLRNGEVLEGHITLADDVYVVDLPDGQIRVRQKDVEVVCRDLEDGYRRKRASIQVGNVHHHLELAQWCLHHNLLGPAAVELADATVADPQNQMIAVLQRRLKMALEPSAPSAPKSTGAAGPSNDELDRMVRGLPPKAVEMFTQSVQPVLLNDCTGSGCHGPQSDGGMRLARIPAGRPATRRITQRNLYSALKYVDRDNPSASRLLSAAVKPHGTVQHAIFDEHQASQYRRLAEWVAQIAEQSMPDSPATVTPTAGTEPADAGDWETPPRALPREARKGQPLPGRAARQPGKNAADGQSAPPPDKRQAVGGGAKPAQPPSKAAPPRQPADPFDPEVFNRRYGPEKK